MPSPNPRADRANAPKKTTEISETPHPTLGEAKVCSPKGSRTPVSGLRGRRPRPLDDGATLAVFYQTPGFCQTRFKMLYWGRDA